MGFIFESEISAIMNTVRARTIGEEDDVRLKVILGAGIHPAIKAYCKSEVERLLQQERTREVRSARFPYGLPEVQGLQRQIDLILVNQYEFGRQEFEAILDESVHFIFNYLCRPRWTLQEFIFENRRTVSLGEILRKLKYCVEYRYFAEIFRRYVSERGLAEVGYEEFKSLMARIDTEVMARYSGRQLAAVLQPLVDFIRIGIPETRVTETGPVIPINAAIVFFEDKRMAELQARLEIARDREGIAEVSLADLSVLIRDARGETDAEELIAAPPIPVPVLEQEIPAGPSEPEPVAAPEPVITTSRTPSAPVIDIYSLFSVKEQKMFVRKIFKKDEVEFRNALDRLNGLPTWEQAALVLDKVFSSQNVDPFSKEAVLFTDKVFSRYSTPVSR